MYQASPTNLPSGSMLKGLCSHSNPGPKPPSQTPVQPQVAPWRRTDIPVDRVKVQNSVGLSSRCRVDTVAGLLPDAFELDERSSWNASDDVLQLVSGRQVRPVAFCSSQPHLSCCSAGYT